MCHTASAFYTVSDLFLILQLHIGIVQLKTVLSHQILIIARKNFRDIDPLRAFPAIAAAGTADQISFPEFPGSKS